MIHFGYAVLISRSVHMSGFLSVLFPSPFTFVHTKVASPPLTKFIIYSICFLTAYKMTSCPSTFASAPLPQGRIQKPKPMLLLMKVKLTRTLSAILHSQVTHFFDTTFPTVLVQPIQARIAQLVESFFLGIFRDLISKVLFEKSYKLILGF